MWYVGQKVVCVKTHSQNAVVEGNIYTIAAINKCCKPRLDVGVRVPFPLRGVQCPRCGGVSSGDIWWMGSSLFRPLDALTEQLERIESEGAPVELEPEYA